MAKADMWVSELHPRIAEHVDDLCFIHSVQADSNNHAPASYQMHTGRRASGESQPGFVDDLRAGDHEPGLSGVRDAV